MFEGQKKKMMIQEDENQPRRRRKKTKKHSENDRKFGFSHYKSKHPATRKQKATEGETNIL